MPRVYISIGSNIERAANIRAGVVALREYFGGLVISSVYESRPVGFAGDDFYNLVAGFDTTQEVHDVNKCLHDIEHQHGRARNGQPFNSRTLDLDLLLYGDTVIHEHDLTLPRDEILRYAFVLRPLAEIAGDEKHPQNGKSYAVLWHEFEQHSQPLWVVDFTW